MSSAKLTFLASMHFLLNKRGLTIPDIYKRTSIDRMTLTRIMDTNKKTMPTIDQVRELCAFFDTTLYFLIEGRGPERANASVVDKMIDVMKAYADPKRPDISIIINLIIKLKDYQALLMIRSVAITIAEKTFNQAALQRTPSDRS